MKQSKKLNYYSKQIVSKNGLNPADWRLLREEKDSILIINKNDGTVRSLKREG